jgi:16S rRNA (guanine527-N7)-methyltransferase
MLGSDFQGVSPRRETPAMPPLVPELQEEMKRCGITISPSEIARIDGYRRHLWQWNQGINLTRHTTLESFVRRDVVDSWQLSQHLGEGESLLDVGTGGGVPGLIISILRPDVTVTACESVGKKARAVEQIAKEASLSVEIVAARAESLLQERRFDVLTIRAVGPMWKMLKSLKPYWKSIGRILLVKGPRWVEERGEARHRGLLARPLELRRVAEYHALENGPASVILQIQRGSSS